MKNKKISILIIFLIFSFILPIFSSSTFAEENTQELSVYSPHCIVIESSTRQNSI